jgi:ribosome-associated protein
MSEETEGLDDGEEGVSRSQRKREMLALQQLGVRLMELSPAEWQALDAGPALAQALEESRRVKGHNARRRHAKRLGKLLRGEEADRVRALFAHLDGDRREERHRLHRLERWRERLLAEGDAALEALLAEAPGADRQRLRQLVREGRRERDEERPPASQRRLFRYLRELQWREDQVGKGAP